MHTSGGVPMQFRKFLLPNATAYVPSTDVDDARARLKANAYDKAPVESWTYAGVVAHENREDLVRDLLAGKSP